MCTKEVILTWDGHHQTMISVFEKLLENSSLVDCIISIEGKKLKAHKEVLSAFSPYLQMILEEENQKNPTLILSGFTFQELSALMEYMYFGKVQIPEDTVESLINAAQLLQIRGLSSCLEKVGPENRDAYSNGITSIVNESCDHPKRRRIGNGKVSSNSLMESGVVESHRFSQKLQITEMCVLQQTKDVAGIGSHTPRLASIGNNCPTNLNLSIFPVKQIKSSLHHKPADPSAKSTPRIDPNSNQIFVTENELEVELKREEQKEDNSVCANSRESYRNNDNYEAILGLSEEYHVHSDHESYDSMLPKQLSSDMPNLPHADVSSASSYPVVNLNSGNKCALSRINQRNAIVSSSSGDHSVSVSDTENGILSIESILKTEPDLENERNIEEMQDESEEWETQRQEENYTLYSGGGYNATEESFSRPHLVGRPKEFPVNCGINSWMSKDDAPSARNSQTACAQRKRICPVCQKEVSNLIRHMKTHTGEKKFKCSQCNYAATRPDHLQIHRRRHTGEKPFKCQNCDYAARQHGSLLQHIKQFNHHSIINIL